MGALAAILAAIAKPLFEVLLAAFLGRREVAKVEAAPARLDSLDVRSDDSRDDDLLSRGSRGGFARLRIGGSDRLREDLDAT